MKLNYLRIRHLNKSRFMIYQLFKYSLMVFKAVTRKTLWWSLHTDRRLSDIN